MAVQAVVALPEGVAGTTFRNPYVFRDGIGGGCSSAPGGRRHCDYAALLLRRPAKVDVRRPTRGVGMDADQVHHVACAVGHYANGRFDGSAGSRSAIASAATPPPRSWTSRALGSRRRTAGGHPVAAGAEVGGRQPSRGQAASLGRGEGRGREVVLDEPGQTRTAPGACHTATVRCERSSTTMAGSCAGGPSGDRSSP
jgi:hypothetical protein